MIPIDLYWTINHLADIFMIEQSNWWKLWRCFSDHWIQQASLSAILLQWPWPLTPTNNNLPKAAIPADLDFSLYYLQNDLQQIFGTDSYDYSSISKYLQFRIIVTWCDQHGYFYTTYVIMGAIWYQWSLIMDEITHPMNRYKNQYIQQYRLQ